MNQINENTYERANDEFVFEEKRKPDEVYFNIGFGTLMFYMVYVMIDVFAR